MTSDGMLTLLWRPESRAPVVNALYHLIPGLLWNQIPPKGEHTGIGRGHTGFPRQYPPEIFSASGYLHDQGTA
jgi:hypothetical protein